MDVLAPGPFAISFLGHCTIALHERPIDATLSKSTVATLAYIALHRDEAPLRRERVAFALWPDEGEKEARANLRRHLHMIARALGNGALAPLVGDTKIIGWNPHANATLDIEQFERDVATPATRAAALDLYRGDLLLDFDEEWLEAPRTRFRELFCNAAIAEAATALAASDGHAAVALARRVLAIDPWREDAVRAHMRGKLALGDRAGALVAYQDFAARLRSDIDAAPMPETTELAEEIARTAGDSAPKHAPVAAVPVSRFIGREEEIATLLETLASSRLVTLTGPGGVGKSRLATETLLRVAPQRDAVVVRLAPATNDRVSVENRVLHSLGVAPSNAPAVEVVARILGTRDTVVYFDNAEHVAGHAGEFITELLARTRDLRVLVSSQHRLRLAGEHVVSLKPLAPDDAIALFMDRARALDRSFALAAEDREAVASVCMRLDGMPLPIELAAARTNVLGVPEIDQRLSDRFDFLRTKNVNTNAQHRTLRATLDWSFDLLDARERTGFERLAVFVNGWTLAAAARVIDPTAQTDDDALECLTELVEKSLVTTKSSTFERRYTYLESIRLYAFERLKASGELTENERVAFAYFRWFVGTRYHRFWTSDEKPAFDEIARDHDNILASLDAAIDRGEIEQAASLASELTPFWLVRGLGAAGERRLDTLVDADRDLTALLRARLRNAASLTHFRRSDIDNARRLAESALACACEARDEHAEAEARMNVARCAFVDERLGDARETVDVALEIYARAGDLAGRARALDFLGLMSVGRRDTIAAAYFTDSLAMYEAMGDLQGIATVNYHLSYAALSSGDFAAAATLGTKASETWREYGNLQGEIWASYNIAVAQAALGHRSVALRLHFECVCTAHRFGFRRELDNGLDRLADGILEDEPEFAVTVLGFAAHRRKTHGHVVLDYEHDVYESCLARARALLPLETYAAAWDAGRTIAEDTLIARLASAIELFTRSAST